MTIDRAARRGGAGIAPRSSRRPEDLAELEDFFENAPIPLRRVGPDGRILRANKAELEYLGYAPGEYIGHHIREFHDDRALIDDILLRLRRGETLRGCEARMVARDGSRRDVLIDSSPLIRDGDFIHARCVTRDNARRKQTEKALQTSEERFRLMLDTANEGVLIIDGDARITYANERLAAMLGLDLHAMTGMLLFDLMDQEMAAEAARRLEHRRDGRAEQFDFRFRHTEGRDVWAIVAATPLFAPDGTFAGSISMITDITVRRRAEEALRESERRLSGMFDQTTVGVAQCLPDGRFVRVNDRYCEIVGQKRDDLLAGMRTYDITHPDDLAYTRTLYEQLLDTGSEFQVEKRYVRPDGSTVWVNKSVSPASGADGRPEYVTAIVVDITDRKRAEAALERALIEAESARRQLHELLVELREALAAKDEFLGMVSHELKTPITTIFGNAEVLRRRGDRLDEASRRDALADMSREAVRLQRIIDNLLVLARLEQGAAIDVEPVVVRRLVANVIDDHRQRYPHRDVRFEPDGSSAPVAAAPLYTEQVVRNLLGNAEKYSPPASTITVRLRTEGDELAVHVLDRGPGLAEEAERLFTPFHRSPQTARHANGVGIGLAVCKRLVEAQGGRVWAHNRAGGGADIGFALPLIEDTAAALDAP